MGTQKIDSSWLKTHHIVITSFQVVDKDEKFGFLEKIFSLADINMNVLFEISFLTWSNCKVIFKDWELE